MAVSVARTGSGDPECFSRSSVLGDSHNALNVLSLFTFINTVSKNSVSKPLCI